MKDKGLKGISPPGSPQVGFDMTLRKGRNLWRKGQTKTQQLCMGDSTILFSRWHAKIEGDGKLFSEIDMNSFRSNVWQNVVKFYDMPGGKLQRTMTMTIALGEEKPNFSESLWGFSTENCCFRLVDSFACTLSDETWLKRRLKEFRRECWHQLAVLAHIRSSVVTDD